MLVIIGAKQIDGFKAYKWKSSRIKNFRDVSDECGNETPNLEGQKRQVMKIAVDHCLCKENGMDVSACWVVVEEGVFDWIPWLLSNTQEAIHVVK